MHVVFRVFPKTSKFTILHSIFSSLQIYFQTLLEYNATMGADLDAEKHPVQHIDNIGTAEMEPKKRSTMQEVWANKRVLMWCKLFIPLHQMSPQSIFGC